MMVVPHPIKCVAFLVSVSFVLSACGGSDSTSSGIDREAVKANHADIAGAMYGDSLTSAEALRNAITDFIADPSDANLLTARRKYKEARVPYQQSELMRWDSAITLGKNLDNDGGPESVDEWEGQVNAWPLDENFIVSLIEGSQEIDKALLVQQNGANENEANVTTGVHAIEFMLWGEDKNGTGPGAGSRPASDYALGSECADGLCARRAQYLAAAAELLVDDLTEMESEWNAQARTTQGTLAYNFLNSDDALDYMLGAIRSMGKGELAGARIFSGLDLGDPEESHDCFSDLSHVAIYNNFQGIKNAFYGRYNTISGPSLADLIRERDDTTFNKIDAALKRVEENISVIFNAGEKEQDPIRFDQIIGQSADGRERNAAMAAVVALTDLDVIWNAAREILSLNESGFEGDGD